MQEEARGDLNLNQTAIGGIPGNRWKRRYDPTGNWRQVEIDKLGSRWSLEDRVHDKGNRLMQVDQHEQSQQPPVEVDAAGRMTKVPLAPGNWTNVSNEVKWDAWNRIVEVQFSASVIGAYAYDALHRRIKRTASGVTWHSYFNDAWKVIEERRASHPAVAAAHYLWGLRHRDDLARRDRATTAGGSMSQRHYVLMDYHNPVAITGTTGTVQERYQFDGFGTRVVLDAGNDPIVVSAYAWSFAFQGQFEDGETGWLNYGFRYYAPGLGRFLSKDPIMEAGGNNLYRMSNNAPVNAVDWLGLGPVPNGVNIQVSNRPALRAAHETASKALAEELRKERDAIKAKQDYDKATKGKTGAQLDRMRRNGLKPPPSYKAKESCGRICKKKSDGCYYTTEYSGEYRSEDRCNVDASPACNDGDEEVGFWHTHPGGSWFSDKSNTSNKRGGDLEFSKFKNKPLTMTRETMSGSGEFETFEADPSMGFSRFQP